MSALAPCDLGDGIEVVHDVEDVEIEMDCALDDDEPAGEPAAWVAEDVGTRQFVRESAPYERIELQLDPGAFRRATIEEAQRR